MKLLFLLLAIWWTSARANWEEGDGGQVLWNHNCEFTGNNIQMRDCSPQTCGACCLANPRCTQFTWMNTNSSKPCVLKNGRRNQRPAFARGFVCGYVPTRICMPGEDFIFWTLHRRRHCSAGSGGFQPPMYIYTALNWILIFCVIQYTAPTL